MNYQKLTIVGNVTRDAERKTSKGGEVTFATLTVAVRDGRDTTTFFPVTLFGRQVEPVVEYVKKGREVLVEGRVELRENKYFGVIADRVVFGKAAEKAEESEPDEKAKPKPKAAPKSTAKAKAK